MKFQQKTFRWKGGIYMSRLETCGTVPNPEKSRLSRPAGQTGLSRKVFGTGQTGSGQFEKIDVPKLFNLPWKTHFKH
jgi:hypothetical protein